MNADLAVVDMSRRTYSANCQAEQCRGGHDMSFVIASNSIVFVCLSPARRLSESSREGEEFIYFGEGNDSHLVPHDQFTSAK
jgi:hypothetical protein